MTPEDVVQKTLGWHRLAVAKLKRHPELLETVRANIEGYKRRGSPRAMHYFLEWEEHFARGSEHLFAIALEESEHAADLRQCSPFGGILTNEERWQYFRDFKAEYEKRSQRPR